MRHEDAGLALWVAGEQSTRERVRSSDDLDLAAAAKAVRADASHSVRQRAGAAVIAFGERLAGNTAPAVRPATRRRLAGQG